MRRGWVIIFGTMILTGCGVEPDNLTETQVPPKAAEPVDTPTTTVAPESDPVDLINLWRVTAESEEPDTWLRLDAGSYNLWRACGFFDGGWRADGHAFFASAPHGWSGACDTPGDSPSMDWLTLAVTYQPTEGGWKLVDADGTELANLTVDGAPPPDPNSADFYREPPPVTDEVRAWLAEPAPLPAGLEPITSAELIGRWVPTVEVTTEPFIMFNNDATWQGSDGCNGLGGGWRLVGDAGRLFVTHGGQTAIGCDYVDLSMWLNTTARVGLDNGTLVLLDQAGEEVGRLIRQ